MKPKNEVKHLRGYIETIEKKYRELEGANAALLEALELAERHIRSEMHSAHVPMQGKDLASIQEAIRNT